MRDMKNENSVVFQQTENSVSPEIGTGDSAIVQGHSKSENGKDDMAKQPTKPHRKMITKITWALWKLRETEENWIISEVRKNSKSKYVKT